MPLQERLIEDLKKAMRQKDDLRRSTIRFVRSAIGYEEIAQQKPLDDAGVVSVLSRLARQHQESIAQFKLGNRPDLVAKEEAELAIVREYLPQQLTLQEITQFVQQAIAESGAKGPAELGKVMGNLMPKVKGRADGSQVSRIVRELLGG